jgi:hypothetical protein
VGAGSGRSSSMSRSSSKSSAADLKEHALPLVPGAREDTHGDLGEGGGSSGPVGVPARGGGRRRGGGGGRGVVIIGSVSGRRRRSEMNGELGSGMGMGIGRSRGIGDDEVELGEPGPVAGGGSGGGGEAVALDLEALLEIVDLVLALLHGLPGGGGSASTSTSTSTSTSRSSKITEKAEVDCRRHVLPVATAQVAVVEQLEAVGVGVEQGLDGAVGPLLAASCLARLLVVSLALSFSFSRCLSPLLFGSSRALSLLLLSWLWL